ncbi:MAG: tryptophan-rich sensory protein [Magnetococcales bacterium]|nr:tryptophan-rich sensory protein [Magnetococcales bacterium]
MKFRKTNPRFGYLVVLIVLCLGVAGISSMVTIPAVHGWYKDLSHPSFTPPDAVFGLVWTALYIMMAVAAWRAWGRDQYQWDSSCIRLFLIQLALNFAWSFLFFKFHLNGVAAVEIVVLEIAIIVTTVAFLMRDKNAGMLMVPYLLWVGFASALNIGFWSHN